MSSYNNIRKIKYTKTPSDVVSLIEYIMFEDSRAKQKYVVFKFSNNVNQRLYEFKFTVLQYDAGRGLIEKSTVSHKDFIAEANDLFVPNAKLKLDFNCDSIEVKLESAVFDRISWVNGQFSDNPYRFDTYAESVAKANAPAPAESNKKLTKAEKKAEKKNAKDVGRKDKKRNKAGYWIKNISRCNRAVFPSVFNVIMCVIFVGLIVFSAFYFKDTTGAFAFGDYVLCETSPGYVTVLDYTGEEQNLTLSSSLEAESEEASYTVSKIAKGAFSHSSLTTLTFNINRPLVIEEGAFVGLGELTQVNGNGSSGKITVMYGAFDGCSALAEFNVGTAELLAGCFKGADSLTRLAYSKILCSKLLEVFDGLESVTLSSVIAYNDVMGGNYLDGITFNR